MTLKSTRMKKLALLFISAALLLGAAPALDWSQVAPDVPQRLQRFKPVEMPFTYEGYSPRERTLIKELVAALRDLEDTYWRQSDPEDIALYHALASDKSERGKAL